MRAARRVRTDAVSDIIGTMILLGVTVSLVAVLAVGVQSEKTAVTDPPRLDVRATAAAGNTHVTLRHVGGADLDEGDIRVVVTVNGTSAYDDTLGSAGTTWIVGETRVVTPLAVTLRPGDLVHVQIVSTPHGATAATATMHVPRTNAAAGGALGNFTANATLGDGAQTLTVKPPASLFLSADIEHPEGRKALRAVTVDLSPIGDSPVAPLHDNGLNGDPLAGDGVYSGFLLVGTNASLGTFQINVTATAFDGSVAEDTVNLTVTDSIPFFNTALIHKMGFQVVKEQGGGGGGGGGTQSTDISAYFKIMVREDPVALDNGNWTLKKVEFEYDAFKPGQYSPKKMNDDAVGPGDWWHCDANGKRIKAFKMENETIGMYRGNRDTLRFYFTLTWDDIDDGDTYITTVEASDQDQWFLLRSHEDQKEMRTDGWPGTFKVC